MTLLSTLIERVLSEYEDRPADRLQTQATRALFDFETCAAAGRRVLPGAFDGAVATAAAAASVLDLEDVHWPSVTHPGPLVWPAVLGAAAAAGAHGSDAVRAAAVGYEVTARLANGLGASHRQYWHATTTAGTVGAAAAAALAAGLDASRTKDAAAHAACVAGGVAQSLVERSGTRVLYRAHAAVTGLAAARAAEGGITATEFALEGPKGLFAATAAGTDPPRAFGGGEHWAIEELWFRIHAATGFAHTAIDAAASLGPLPVAAVRSIRIVAPPASLVMAGDLDPVTRMDGWWSVPYATAVALVHGDPAAIAGPELQDVRDLLARTAMEAGDGDLAATVDVDVDGDMRSATATFPTGHPERPLDEDQRLSKWESLGAGSAEDGRALLALAYRLPELTIREYLAARPATAVAFGFA
jgi:2-methylcitrate dehydratase PrpD